MAMKKRASKKPVGRSHAKKKARSTPHQAKRISDRKSSRSSRPSVSRSRIRPVKVLTADQRASLKSALQLVRKHVKGYETSDGWKVKDFTRITPQRRATVLKKARELRVLLAQPHDVVRARSRRDRHELYKFTHQKIRKAKHFIVHKPADNFSVRLVRGRVSVRGTFSGRVSGKRRRKVVTESAFYLFPHTAHDEREAADMLEDMLDSMPEGFYVMLTGAHGDTGEPVERGQLLARLRDYINRYQSDSIAVYDRQGNFVQRRETDTGFVQAITGFRYLATSIEGMELQMQARDARRRRGEEFNARLKREQTTARERQRRQSAETEEQKRLKRKRAAKKAAQTRLRKHK